jgi:GNAT superfamily N-acetyltransferase
MASLYRYTNEDLPISFEHQIRDFIRIHWFDIFQFNIHARALPDEPALYSHAGVSTQSVECNGQSYSCGGLDSVFTYPAFRMRGYGSQVVEATAYLRTCDFDIALLWTDDDKEQFYGRWGGALPLTAYCGGREERTGAMGRLYDDDPIIREGQAPSC